MSVNGAHFRRRCEWVISSTPLSNAWANMHCKSFCIVGKSRCGRPGGQQLCSRQRYLSVGSCGDSQWVNGLYNLHAPAGPRRGYVRGPCISKSSREHAGMYASHGRPPPPSMAVGRVGHSGASRRVCHRGRLVQPQLLGETGANRAENVTSRL